MLTPFVYYRTFFEQSPKNHANAKFTLAAISYDSRIFYLIFTTAK